MQRITQDIKVEDMAEQVSMSPRNFARFFLNDTGLTPAKFLEKLRIEIARKYLEDSDLSTEQPGKDDTTSASRRLCQSGSIDISSKV